MKKLAAVFFTLLFASTASAQVIMSPSTNARMDGMGVANWQIEDDFNIWINPGQISNYKNNVYGELGIYQAGSSNVTTSPNASGGGNSVTNPNQDGIISGSQWGGMNMDVSYGEWGVYIGRPYTGASVLTSIDNPTTTPTPHYTMVGASPLGLASFGLSGPLGMMGAGSTPTNNRVDLFYGLHSAQPMGLYLSYADQSEKNTIGGTTNKDDATEWNIGAGGIFGGGVLDAAIDITLPPSAKCNDSTGGNVSCGFDPSTGLPAANQFKSDAGPSLSLLGRHHANMGNSKLLTTAQILYIDASSKDTSGSGIKIDNTTVGWRIDTALNSKPIPDALVVVGIGLAGANTQAKFNQGIGKVTLDQLAIPVNIAIEHQTFKVLKTRFGLSKPLYNSSNCKDTAGAGFCVTGTGFSGTTLTKVDTVSDGAATVSFGVGWAVMDNLSIDAVVNQDVLFSGTYMISGVAETLNTKLSATYRFK
ncbi:MAG TPA: hypothetical protein VFH55_06680 [Nitrospiria bacterium]|nr:hypothetical protein [Nitrospiria bacterium]